MIKQELVLEQKWITVEKFNRVLAVYQVGVRAPFYWRRWQRLCVCVCV
jgi:hypothetical protein